ncbi:hypothetical protein VP1G_03251 [Cytospora mali]|uniref:Uncharacterized protein n=1 Tax=Cytospora mali TaxID=578113 RepID=A0A194UVX9_CYTMA|nr:hypothetical protein VP1G_03251 [Valsa mali var. pyri (nom. inval.)]
MKSTIFRSLVILVGLPFTAAISEIRNPTKQYRYTSGAVMDAIMVKKRATWEAQEAAGLMDSTIYPSYTGAGPVLCVDGVAQVIPGDANNIFRCKNCSLRQRSGTADAAFQIDFYDFKSHADLGSVTGRGSSTWGWTSPKGREFIAIAQADGAAFAEVSPKGKLIYLGRLPHFPKANPIIWREIRGYKNYILVGSEADYHGIQIFDMTKLVDIDPVKPLTFSGDADLTGHFTRLPVGRTHNVVVNEELNYAVAVGAKPRDSECASGLIFIDLSDPSKPTSPGCAAGDGYVHDAQCLVYRGPDKAYAGRDICYGYNEDTLTIYDVTNKSTTNIISRTSYDGASYTHQGWVTDMQWQTMLVLDDEYDEVNSAGAGSKQFPITYFWNITSLETPVLTGFFRNEYAQCIDHNQFVINGTAYQSNYGAGLHVLDVSSLSTDPTGAGVSEAGFFDIYPEDDNLPEGGTVAFVGTWGHYPFFPSGFIVVNTIERGAFVVKRSNA